MPVDLADYRKRARNHKWDGTTGCWSCEDDMNALLDELEKARSKAVNADGETPVEENNRLRHDGLFCLVRPEKWTPRTPNELPQFVREVSARAPELEVDNRGSKPVHGVSDKLKDEFAAATQKASYDYWAVTHSTMGVAANPYKEGIVIVDDGAPVHPSTRERVIAFYTERHPELRKVDPPGEEAWRTEDVVAVVESIQKDPPK